MEKADFLRELQTYGQSAFVSLFEGMNEDMQEAMLKQADLLDLSMLENAKPHAVEEARGLIEPIETLTMEKYEKNVDRYRELGIEAIRKGRIAALVLAGGMGTRLGFEHAKGMYDIGITHSLYIFECMMKNMLEVVKEAGTFFHLFIMTSSLNDGETREFFAEHDYFGYDSKFVHFYVQDMSPCLDDAGNMFLSAPGTIAMSPNGNGGFYSSLVNSGLSAYAKSQGIEYINVFAVDNVLQKIVDPVFVGALIESGCATGAKVVKKASPDEKVGAICLEDGTPSVVEYYEMTKKLKDAKLADGSPAYNYGVILNYLFRTHDIDEVVRERLPVHVVKKKVPYLGEDGITTVNPEAPNAYKLETLTLDLVHLTDSCLSFEVDRLKEFAPIKNAEGVDSVESARELLKLNGVVL